MSIDLHIHSNHSDGTFSPAEIAKRAKERGLTAFSITDHDTLSGLHEASEAALKLGIEAISGIELSVEHRGIQLHILGYLFDQNHNDLQHKVEVLQNARKQRNLEIVVRLKALGVDITMEEVKRVSQLGQTGRPHFAQVLVNKGVVKNVNQAFTEYLKKGKKAYVHRFVFKAEEAITLLKESGGLAVLAHPCQIDSDLSKVSGIIRELARVGLDGVEVYYPTHSTKIRRKLRKIAERHGLVMSGGSDYHGRIRPGTDLAGGNNVFVPGELLHQMKQRWQGLDFKGPARS